jgi:acetate---CoA ligase (ADP-forming)
MAWLAARVRSAPIPVIPVSLTCTDVSGYARESLGAHGINLIAGVELGAQALGNALRWLDRRGTVRPLAGRPSAESAAALAPAAAWTEADARDLLAAAGVPLVPGRLVRSADDAAAAARELGTPVALKINSARITHKSDIGAVLLNVTGDEAVRAGYERVVAAGQPHQGGNEVLVTSMRDGGVEVLAGVTLDPAFGPVLAVGLGGVWVEVLRDTSLRLLPAGPDEVRRMFAELRGLPLLQGERGGVPTDLDALALVIARIGALAGSVPGLQALEVNPLWVRGDEIAALDALVVADQRHAHRYPSNVDFANQGSPDK